jgi:hypothetical protein
MPRISEESFEEPIKIVDTDSPRNKSAKSKSNPVTTRGGSLKKEDVKLRIQMELMAMSPEELDALFVQALQSPQSKE